MRYDCPSDALEDILACNREIHESKESADVFDGALDSFYKQGFSGGGDGLKALDPLEKSCPKAHIFTVHLLYYICLSKALRTEYQKAGIAESVYVDSMADLFIKLQECRDVYGINGSFVAGWFFGFFRLSRFTLGRMQYEIIPFWGHEDYSKQGHILHPKDPVINIHIPKGGRLSREVRMESYQRAADFFQNQFEAGKPIPFVCSSWLIYPEQKNFLPPTSNLLSFMEDFDILMTKEGEGYQFAWRLFDRWYNGNPKTLPRNNSLRRAYADRMAAGLPAGTGYGVFFYQNGTVL